MNKTNKFNKAFTLIEVLIVVGIISVLAVALIITINPGEIFKEARDSTRIRDMSALEGAISLYEADIWRNPQMGQPQRVYISIPDTSQSCNTHLSVLPGLPQGWSYRCVTEDNLYNIDGTGWIPVNLTDINLGSPISRLPIDPVNDAEQGLYYAYVTSNSYAVATLFESEIQLQTTTRTQGEFDPERYVTGTDITLWRDAYGIVGLWPLDEGSGDIARDKSGNGNNLGIVNNPIWRSGEDCVISSCLSFSSSSDYMRLNEDIDLSSEGDTITLSFWVNLNNKTDGSGSLQSFIGSGTQPHDIGYIWCYTPNSPSYLRCQYATEPGINRQTFTFSNFYYGEVGNWIHAAVVIDYDNNTAIGYKNGNLFGSYSSSFDMQIPIPRRQFFASYSAGGHHLDGLMDDIRIYNRSLSAGEIRTIYNAAR